MLAGALEKFGVVARVRQFEGGYFHVSLRYKSAELLSPLQYILGLRAVERGAIKGSLNDFLVGQRNIETGAKLPQLAFVELFLLMGNIASFTAFAEAVTLNGLCQYDGRGSLVVDRSEEHTSELQSLMY